MEVKASVAGNLINACSMFLQDLEVLPEEAFTKNFGGKTRTVADFVYEVILVNDHIGMVIRGEDPFKWPNELWIKAPEDFQTKEAVIAGFKKSSEKAIATAEAFSEEDLEGTVETEHGPRTRFARCQHMTLHLWYHMGQLNYIQTLLGDDAWNWT